MTHSFVQRGFVRCRGVLDSALILDVQKGFCGLTESTWKWALQKPEAGGDDRLIVVASLFQISSDKV
jgi:hypothetical protein